MSELERLLDVQEHDTKLDQLHHRRETLPAREELTGAARRLEELDRRKTVRQGERDELDRQQRRLEDEVEAIGAKASQEEGTLYGGTITSPRELQALQEEIDALRRRQRSLEDQVLDLMTRTEPVDEELAEIDHDREALEREAEGIRALIGSQEVEIDAEADAVKAERESIATAVPPDALTSYERLRQAMGGIAVARLIGGRCGGCNLTLSAVEKDRIKGLPSDATVTCEECGRLLVH